MLLLILLLCLSFWQLIKNDKEILITDLTKAEKLYVTANVIAAYILAMNVFIDGKPLVAGYISIMLPYMIFMAIIDHRTMLVYPSFVIIYLILAEVVCVLEFSMLSISILLIPIIFYIIYKLKLFEAGDISIASVGVFAFVLVSDFWYDRLLMTLFMLMSAGIYFIAENIIHKNVYGFLKLKSPAAFSPALLFGTEITLFVWLI